MMASGTETCLVLFAVLGGPALARCLPIIVVEKSIEMAYNMFNKVARR